MKLRKLTIGKEVYLWGLKHRYVRAECEYIFTSYLDGRKASPFILLVKTWADARIGGPLHTGKVRLQLDDPKSPMVNLNESGMASTVIRYAKLKGWSPESSRKKFIIDQGFSFLREAI